jgi:hypothetical protein
VLEALVRRGTVYAVTNRRVVICHSGPCCIFLSLEPWVAALHEPDKAGAGAAPSGSGQKAGFRIQGRAWLGATAASQRGRPHFDPMQQFRADWHRTGHAAGVRPHPAARAPGQRAARGHL